MLSGAKLASSMSGQAMEEPIGAASNADTTCDANSVGNTSQVRHTLGECYLMNVSMNFIDVANDWGEPK